MKQTAVEWLFQQLWEEPKDKLTWHSILEQAKEMEKEQLLDMGNQFAIMGEDNPEQYYNKTYKSE